MFCVPGDVYSSTTCSAPHAIALVFVSCYFPVERSSPPHLCLALTLPSDTGDRPYQCLYCGDQFARRSVALSLFIPTNQSTMSTAIFFQDTSTNVTPTRGLTPPLLPARRVPLPPAPLPQNRPATSVSSPVSPVTAPIHAVRPYHSLSPLTP